MALGPNNTQLLKYLDKNYYVLINEKKFFRRYGDVHEWGRSIRESLSVIFSLDQEFCELTFQFWASNEGLRGREFEEALGPRKLKCEWNPELAQDLQTLHGIQDAERNLVAVLSEQIAAEIDAQILRDLRDEIKTGAEFISLVKCIGYEPGAVIIDPVNFASKKKFVSMNYNDIINERQSNLHWQDWIKNRPS